jgi:hypothetical protein
MTDLVEPSGTPRPNSRLMGQAFDHNVPKVGLQGVTLRSLYPGDDQASPENGG